MTSPPPLGTPWRPTVPPHLTRAAGAVVVDPERHAVLLREVAGGYGGAAWSFAKGTPELGESDEHAALREAREELGVVGEIVGELSGWWIGTTTATRFFVVRALGPLGRHDAETSSVRWVSIDEARALIGFSSSLVVRRRDLAVLDALIQWAE